MKYRIEIATITVAALAVLWSATPFSFQPVATAQFTDSYSTESYGRVLSAYVNDEGMVNYKDLKAHRQALDQYLATLAAVSPETYATWTPDAKIAFWINAYNAITLTAVIDHFPIQSSFLKSLAYPKNSIRQISGVWTDLEWTVMGKPITLDAIEHKVLRAQFEEPRIHAALVCAAMSCPPLRAEPYTGDTLDAQLDDQMKRFLAHPKKFRIDRTDNTVYLSPIFKWFGKDFVAKYKTDRFKGHSEVERAVLNVVSQYVAPEDKEYLESADLSIAYLDYDWTLNEQRDAGQ